MHKFSDFPCTVHRTCTTCGCCTCHFRCVPPSLLLHTRKQNWKSDRENITENMWRLSNYQTEWITEQTEAYWQMGMHCSYCAGFESTCKGKRYIPLLDAHQTFSKAPFPGHSSTEMCPEFCITSRELWFLDCSCTRSKEIIMVQA